MIEKCNNSSAPGPDKLTWRHLKSIIRSEECICKLIDIANVYIDLGYWLSYFKTSTMVVIPKPNKMTFNFPKLYHSIVLLNTIGKLFKKIIGKHLQFHMISDNFIHHNQLGGLKQRFTADIEVALTHIICLEWVKNLVMSTLVFNIAQFFPFLNHQLLSLIPDKMGLDHKISIFFKNYLVGRKTTYLWNDFISPLFNINVGVG